MKKIMFNDKYGLTDAVLQGRKTMTRRFCGELLDWPYSTEPKIFYDEKHGDFLAFRHKDDLEPWILLPKYVIGEEVAVAQPYKDVYNTNEEWLINQWTSNEKPVECRFEEAGWGDKRSVRAYFMPHRIRITNIKVERLQDISDEDCLKEGLYVSETFAKYGVPNGYSPNCKIDRKEPKRWFETPRSAFAALIDAVSGKGTWESNPYVFAYTFELMK